MSTSFGVRSSMRSAAARRIEAAGRAFQAAQEQDRTGGASGREIAAPAAQPRQAHSAGASMPPPPENAPRILFRAPIEPTRPAAARRDAGKGQCRAIIEEVAAKYQVPVKDILSDRRAHVLIPPRHEAMFRCVDESPLSLPAIGRIFNRDHTSIGHAVMRHHLRTGDPLPRGMDWKSGRRKRR